MASISREKNGGKTLYVACPDGKRRPIRLGKVSVKHATAVKVRVEDLVSAKLTNCPPSDQTSRWLASLDDVLHSKIAALGLVKPRLTVAIGQFTRDYIDQRADIKPATRINLDRARAYLLEVFDAE
jgi:hypothetical protein